MKRLIAWILPIIIVMSLTLGAFAAEKKSATSLVDEANEAYDGKQYEKCISLCDEAISVDACFIMAYQQKSSAQFRLGQYDKAAVTLESLLKLNPRNALALYNITCAYSVLEQKEKALAYLEQAIESDISFKENFIKDTDLENIKNTDAFRLATGIRIRLEGELLKIDTQPVNVNGRILLPMRALFEALGATVNWDAKTRSVTASKGDISLKLTLDSKEAVVNGKNITLDVAPTLHQSKTLVPVRFVAESLNAKVEWDESSRYVNIMTEMPNGANEDYSKLSDLCDVVTVDGIYPEPYMISGEEANCFIVFKDKKAIEMFGELTQKKKEEFMYKKIDGVFGNVLGCEPVHMFVVFDGNAYYTGDMSYIEENISDLRYYKRGMPVNIVVQDKEAFTYSDYYLKAY